MSSLGHISCPIAEANFLSIFWFWFLPIAFPCWKDTLFAYFVSYKFSSSISIDKITVMKPRQIY